MRMRFRDKKVDRDWLNSNFPCMMACPAGTNAGRYVSLIAEGRFEEASWEEAYEYTVKRLSYIKAAFGPDAIGGLSSARCTNEENYAFQKMIRAAVGTNNVDHCARL